MRCVRLLAAFAVTVAFVHVTVGAVPQEARRISGTVVTLSGNTLKAKVGDDDMVFTLDQATRVIGPGAAEAEGQAGPPLSSLMKAGEAIEVHYTAKTSSGDGCDGVPTTVNSATVIRLAPAPAGAKPEAPGRSVSGQVVTVTGNGLTLKAESTTYSFTIDPANQVLGHGFGKQTAGQPPKLADFVSVNDLILVDYVETGAYPLDALEIHLLRKAPK